MAVEMTKLSDYQVTKLAEFGLATLRVRELQLRLKMERQNERYAFEDCMCEFGGAIYQ